MPTKKPFSLILLIVFILAACSPSGASVDLIKPSDKIGKMRVNRYGHTDATLIWDYCPVHEFSEPGIQTVDCTVPMVSELFIGLGISATDKDQREALWEARTWELSIDDYPVDLPSFNIADFERDQGEKTTAHRIWRIRLRNLTPGEHSLHYVMHVNQAVPGDPAGQIPGTYELVVKFTVQE